MSKMLIDARHPEETRVVVLRGNRIEEFDFEAEAKRQLKGNIYLAKVTRVEPSLQAAFVEYGGNRHGFLPLSEIHPDYYQIPQADRDALLQAERDAHVTRDAHHDDEDDDHLEDMSDEALVAEAIQHAEDHQNADTMEDTAENISTDDGDVNLTDADHGSADLGSADLDSLDHSGVEPETVQDRPAEITEVGASDEAEAEAARRRRTLLRRHYKIQEVIRRRQILLVQVVKEERGGKGAALTTYMSLAGRYSVLMPNTTNSGGISRKIAQSTDRRRLKEIMSDLQLPMGMGCIIRTAGLKRTKVEIRRDFDYLTRLWDEIRETTMHSEAPALVYEDSSLVKRAIRDIYNKDIDEVIVDGEPGYRAAKDFMRLLMPSHAKRVQLYREPAPLFQRYQVEAQLETMYHPTVQLKSGGYIVINPTEALVSIDINSGRSTKEHNIEETAVKTNCEAADEIARQLRLRDMAGLVVIDFIDMDENRNIKTVERRLKEALKNDRARIQVGRISNFGLMEMSRQRLRTGVLEASTHVCPTCTGAGFVRSVPSSALFALRGLEDEAGKGRASELTLKVPADVAIYILNNKRVEIADVETRCGVTVEVQPSATLMAPEFEIDRAGGPPTVPPAAMLAPMPIEPEDDIPDDIDDEEIADTSEREDDDRDDADSSAAKRDTQRADRDGDGNRGRKRRRRKRRGGRDHDETKTDGEQPVAADSANGNETVAAPPLDGDGASDGEGGEGVSTAEVPGDDAEAENPRRRRRGRRGGRNRGKSDAGTGDEAQTTSHVADGPVLSDAQDTPNTLQPAELIGPDADVPDDAADKPKRVRKPRVKKTDAPDFPTDASAEIAVEAKPSNTLVDVPDAKMVAAPVVTPDPVVIGTTSSEAIQDVAPANTTPISTRKGWWQRTFNG